MSNIDLSQFDDVFDKQIEDLKELPSFVPPPTGTYNLAISVGFKAINDKPAVEVRAIVRELVEQEDETETPAKPGDEFNYAFILVTKEGKRNETAEGFMREFLSYFTEFAGTSNVKELIDGRIKDVECTAFVKRKVNKQDSDRWDVNIKDVVIA